ncbi:hypothetical protein GCM10010504_62780 [Streptomyces griseus]|nr:hypothetical protein GCM10010504_62780 [Streptomyces griseus]
MPLTIADRSIEGAGREAQACLSATWTPYASGPGSHGAAGAGGTASAAQASIRFRSPAGTATASVLPGGGKGQMK